MEETTNLVSQMEHEDEPARWSAVAGLAAAADAGTDLSAAVPALARALGDPAARIRARAAYTLVSIAEHGQSIAAALPALVRGLGDSEEAVREEAVWAVYCLASDGEDIALAAPALVQRLGDTSQSVRGNGAIALALHYLSSDQAEDAQTLLQHGDGAVQFGSAWGHAEFYLRKEARAELRALFGRIRIGLLDVALRDGIAGGIAWARRRGRDVSLAYSVLQEMLAGTKDPTQQAPLYGILMKLGT